MTVNLYERFERNVREHPHKPAFIYFDERNWTTLTYQNIFDETQRFISGLEAGPLTPGMTAALMSPPSADFFPFALALLKLGIVPILLEPAIGIKRIGEIFQESKPDIFVGNMLTHTLRILFGWGKNSIKHNLTIHSLLRIADHASRTPQSVIHKEFTSTAIIYTSGSTGLPKGAIYTQKNLAAQLELLKNTFNITSDEVDLPAFPLYALIDLLLGVTSVIPDITFPVPGKTDAAKVIGAIQKFNVTNMFASPVVLEILASWWSSSPAVLHGAYRDHPLSSLKRIITAGAPATLDLQKQFRNLLENHTDLFGIYGATESLPIAKVESREIFSLKEKTECGAGICLGKPIEGVTVRIIPITDEPIEVWQDSLTVKPNVVGEITVQSQATTREYLNRPESNRLSKIFRHCEEGALPDEAISKSEHGIASGEEQERPRNDMTAVIHRMGDVGYFDKEGRLWYCGRKSHRVVIKDDVLFTEQIENIFNAHPQVFRTALVGVNGKPVLWVELQKHVRGNKDKIRNQLMEIATGHPQASKITSFLFMKKFPTDVRHNSKIIREALTMLAKQRLA